MISGLTQEIARLNAIGETCDDEWPTDFDPNDAMVYDSFRQELERNAGRNTIIDLKNYSKVDAFSMALLPGFVIKNLSELSLADIESACRIYAQYVAHRCTAMLETGSDNTSERRQLMHMLSQVIAFPGLDNE